MNIELEKMHDLLIMSEMQLAACKKKLAEAERALIAVENGASNYRVLQILKSVFGVKA
jgi:hypothetical protein